MIVYGSYALKKWFPDFERTLTDIDIVTLDKDDFNNSQDLYNELMKEGLPIEVNDGDFFSCILDHCQDNFVLPDGLLTVKVSHAMYDWKWHKTIADIIFLKLKGCKIDFECCKELRKGWKKVYAGWREPMNMDQTPETFFNSQVARYIDHDELHEEFKIDSIPAYKKILVDNNKVKVSKDQFNELSLEEQLSTALEEICVLACERYFMIDNPQAAYMSALKDFVTRMTNGWYNLFILDNIIFFYFFQNKKIIGKIGEMQQKIRSQYESDNRVT